MKEWGVVVPMVTPCLPTGALDLTGIRQVSQEMTDAGCSCIFVAGSTGRGPWLDREQKDLLCRTVVDQVGSISKVIAGCTGMGLPDMLENASSIADSGASAAVITIPVYFKYNQQELIKIISTFADCSPIPVIVYDIPDFTNNKLDVQTILKLVKHENIIGIKDSTNDYLRFQELLTALKYRNDFYLMQGKEKWLMDSIKLGASGFVVSLIHVFPPLFTSLYELSCQQNWEKAEIIQQRINEVIDLVVAMFQVRPEISTLYYFLNQVLKDRGVCENILLEHENHCPDYIAISAKKALDIFRATMIALK